jgi:hypothetical protein
LIAGCPDSDSDVEESFENRKPDNGAACPEAALEALATGAFGAVVLTAAAGLVVTVGANAGIAGAGSASCAVSSAAATSSESSVSSASAAVRFERCVAAVSLPLTGYAPAGAFGTAAPRMAGLA